MMARLEVSIGCVSFDSFDSFDSFLRGQMHERRPVPQVVDDGQIAAAAGHSGLQFLRRETGALRAPRLVPGFHVVVFGFSRQRFGATPVQRASTLLFFSGSCHERIVVQDCLRSVCPCPRRALE